MLQKLVLRLRHASFLHYVGLRVKPIVTKINGTQQKDHAGLYEIQFSWTSI